MEGAYLSMFADECEKEAFEYCSDLTDEELEVRGYSSRKECFEDQLELCYMYEDEIEWEEPDYE